MNYKKHYDLVLLTRYDILFLKDFTIDIHKMNMVSILEHPYLCDDNLYIFPMCYLPLFISIFEKKCIEFEKYKGQFHYHLLAHYLKNDIENAMPVNYICNEYTQVPHLSFFKIR